MLGAPVLATGLWGLLLIQGPGQGSSETIDYERAIAEVEATNVAVNRNPEGTHQDLMDALEHLSEFETELSADPDTRELIELSMLNLARALLVAEQHDSAIVVMDEVIRASRGRTLPIERFGPILIEFHDQRRAALERLGTAEIKVECALSCQVMINNQPTSGGSGSLLLGTYRLWIRSTDGSVPPERHELELEFAGGVEVLHFPIAGLPVVSEAPTPEPVARILPRWAELGVAVLGVGAIVGGGIAMSFDGNCPGGGDPQADAQACPLLYQSAGAGWTAIGIGAALAATGGVLLTIDEVRVGDRKGHQANLSWTLRF